MRAWLSGVRPMRQADALNRFALPLAAAAGALAASGFPPYDLPPATLAGVVGLLLLIGCAGSRSRAAAVGWAFGAGHFALGFDWIAKAFTYQAAMPAWLGWVAVLGLAVFLAVYPALACAVAWRRGGGIAGRTLVLAAAWMFAEWLRGHLFTGFAWNPLGLALLRLDGASRLAAVFGGLGLSGLTVLLGGGVLRAAQQSRLAGATAVAALALYGVVLDPLLGPAPRPGSARARLVHLIQPNIGKDADRDEMATLSRYLSLTQMAFARGPGVAIWPEGSVRGPVEDDPDFRRALASVVPPGSLLLFGGNAVIRDGFGRVTAATNSVFALDHTGTLVGGRYDKAHLVPGGEYMPLAWLADPLGLRRLVPGEIDFRPGPGPRTLRYPGLPPVGQAICYEIIFPAELIDRGDRPEWVLTVSDDAWYGVSGPPQHWAHARLRAIEEGLPVVRATPTGVSGVIDARGRVIAVAASGTVAVVSTALPPPLPATPFARAGHLMTLAFGLLLVGAGVWADRRFI